MASTPQEGSAAQLLTRAAQAEREAGDPALQAGQFLKVDGQHLEFKYFEREGDDPLSRTQSLQTTVHIRAVRSGERVLQQSLPQIVAAYPPGSEGEVAEFAEERGLSVSKTEFLTDPEWRGDNWVPGGAYDSILVGLDWGSGPERLLEQTRQRTAGYADATWEQSALATVRRLLSSLRHVREPLSASLITDSWSVQRGSGRCRRCVQDWRRAQTR